MKHINFAGMNPKLQIDLEGNLVLVLCGVEVLAIENQTAQVFPITIHDENDKAILAGMGLVVTDDWLDVRGRATEPILRLFTEVTK